MLAEELDPQLGQERDHQLVLAGVVHVGADSAAGRDVDHVLSLPRIALGQAHAHEVPVGVVDQDAAPGRLLAVDQDLLGGQHVGAVGIGAGERARG